MGRNIPSIHFIMIENTSLLDDLADLFGEFDQIKGWYLIHIDLSKEKK